MANFQKQLEQYRLQKQRKETFENIKSKFWNFLMLGPSKCDTRIDVQPVNTEIHGQIPVNNLEDVASNEEEIVFESLEPKQVGQESKFLKYTLWTVYFLFWITLYVIAIELKFGLVFLMFSALFGIYFNTRTSPKDSNEMSAYSVFNKDCHSIDGTLKAEQFEREMRYGSASVR